MKKIKLWKEIHICKQIKSKEEITKPENWEVSISKKAQIFVTEEMQNSNSAFIPYTAELYLVSPSVQLKHGIERLTPRENMIEYYINLGYSICNFDVMISVFDKLHILKNNVSIFVAMNPFYNGKRKLFIEIVSFPCSKFKSIVDTKSKTRGLGGLTAYDYLLFCKIKH